MASNRLEKIGTIFTRVTGLLRSGAVKWEDKPLWYNVYRAFPPIKELTYDSVKPEDPIKNIFYNEDKIRAKFHERQRNLEAVRLTDSSPSPCQSFVERVELVQKEKNTSGKEAFNEVFKSYKSSDEKLSSQDFSSREKKNEGSVSNISHEFQQAVKNQESTGISKKAISNIFDDKK